VLIFVKHAKRYAKKGTSTGMGFVRWFLQPGKKRLCGPWKTMALPGLATSDIGGFAQDSARPFAQKF